MSNVEARSKTGNWQGKCNGICGYVTLPVDKVASCLIGFWAQLAKNNVSKPEVTWVENLKRKLLSRVQQLARGDGNDLGVQTVIEGQQYLRSWAVWGLPNYLVLLRWVIGSRRLDGACPISPVRLESLVVRGRSEGAMTKPWTRSATATKLRSMVLRSASM